MSDFYCGWGHMNSPKPITIYLKSFISTCLPLPPAPHNNIKNALPDATLDWYCIHSDQFWTKKTALGCKCSKAHGGNNWRYEVVFHHLSGIIWHVQCLSKMINSIAELLGIIRAVGQSNIQVCNGLDLCTGESKAVSPILDV